MPWYRVRFGAEVVGVPGTRVFLWAVLLAAVYVFASTYAEVVVSGEKAGTGENGGGIVAASAVPRGARPEASPASATARLNLLTPARVHREGRPTRMLVKGLLPDQRIEIELERDGYLSAVQAIVPGADPPTVELRRVTARTVPPARTVVRSEPVDAPPPPAPTAAATPALDENPY
jgi:hypothetical protein